LLLHIVAAGRWGFAPRSVISALSRRIKTRRAMKPYGGDCIHAIPLEIM
jgi:hypothetical protein